MKALYADWDCFGEQDILKAFAGEGIGMVSFAFDKSFPHENPALEKTLAGLVEEHAPAFLFSFNYFPVLSAFCKKADLPYLAWVYDSPYVLCYSSTLINPCNRVFLFDRPEYEFFHSRGIPTVFYLPLAADPERLAGAGNPDVQNADAPRLPDRQASSLELPAPHAGMTVQQHEPTASQDAPSASRHETAVSQQLPASGPTARHLNRQASYAVSFVGSLYTESHNFYDRMTSLSERARGYLEGLMEAQLHLFGANLIAETLPEWVIEEMKKDLPMEPNPDGVETLNYLFGEYVVNRKLTSIERKRTLEHIADTLIVDHTIPALDLFTPDASYAHPGIRNHGTVNYLTEMPSVFSSSKINLNITLRSIHSGIPLRCFDIIGSGGFLISNVQTDFPDCFTPGEDLVLYDDIRQLPELVRYYLSHEKEREEIAAHGLDTLKGNHTWAHRVKKMLETL